MMRQRWTALAFMAGLACAASGPASAGNAEDDTIRARLVETGNGIRVVFKFSELTKNDTKKPYVNPILKRQLLKTKGSAGIDALYFRGGGKKGPLKVVVKFTKSFLNKVYADGSEFHRVRVSGHGFVQEGQVRRPVGLGNRRSAGPGRAGRQPELI